MARASKRTYKQRVGEYVLAGLLSVILLVLLWAVWGLMKKEEIARSAVEDRKAELAVLKERKAVFEENLAELETDRGQEATLRQNHGVARAGEEVIIVVPLKDEELEPVIPWYTRLLGWFGVW